MLLLYLSKLDIICFENENIPTTAESSVWPKTEIIWVATPTLLHQYYLIDMQCKNDRGEVSPLVTGLRQLFVHNNIFPTNLLYRPEQFHLNI